MDLCLASKKASEDKEEWVPLRRGWFLGGQKFRKELLAQMSERRRASHYGQEAAESDIQRAECVVESDLGRLGWKEAQLGRRRKGDPK